MHGVAWSAVTPTRVRRGQPFQERSKERSVDRLDDLLLERGVPVVTGLSRPFQMDVNEREPTEELSRYSCSLPVAHLAVRPHGADVAVLQVEHAGDPPLDRHLGQRRSADPVLLLERGGWDQPGALRRFERGGRSQSSSLPSLGGRSHGGRPERAGPDPGRD